MEQQSTGHTGEHRILKELSNPQKSMSLLGIDLEARQFALIAALLAPLALLFRLGLFQRLDLNTPQTLAVVGPFIVGVVLFAFVKWEGRDLSFIVMKKLQSLMREKLLVWRARPPGSMMWLRDSVQRYLPADEPVWNMLKTTNGTYLRIIEIEASSLSLASEEQMERMRSRLAEAYTAFDFPVTEITRSRPSAMGTYIARLQDEMEDELGRKDISEQEAIRLRTFGDGHVRHLKDIVSERQAYEHKSFIVVTYNPQLDEVKDSASPVTQLKDLLTPFIPFVGSPTSKRATVKAQEDAIAAHRRLSERVETVCEYYARLGLTPRLMGMNEGLFMIREETGGANLSGVTAESGAPAETQTPFTLGPVITLTDTQYAKLSEGALQSRVEAAEEVRREEHLMQAAGERDGAAHTRSPHVVGLGELAVNDRIAPDAVEVGSDMLRVGDTYHRTLYIYDLPETVRMGFLQSLVEMKHRIKVVKYIQPIPTKTALDIIGRKKSQLLASENTTSQGDVRERERKRLAKEAAEYALKAIQAGGQRYYELAVLVHLEADSPEALETLTDKVKTKLDERYASSRLALEEMFEGYISCLPFGENHLVSKYCVSGILTDPLSCFSTFSSLEINHPRGVLYGTDQNTGAPVLLDDTMLSNRHKIILGGSGQGKTVLVKALSTRARARGETNILIDPEGRTRYERVAKAIGGQFTKLGQGSTSRINPFDLSADYPDLDKLGDSVDDDEDPEEALRVAREGAFAAKVTTLVSLIGLMATATDSAASARGGLTPGQRGRVERIVAETYGDAGINEDPETHGEDPPVMGDFFAKLTDYAERDDKLAELLEDLYSWNPQEGGTLSKIFDGPTNVDLRSKYLVVRISAAENGPEKAPLMFVLLDFLRGRLADPRESITCLIDELWSLLKYPMAVELLNQLWRASRASGTSMVGITQDLEEFLGSEQASTIMRQSQTYALLGQSKSTIAQIAGFTELSETLRKKIANFARGEALLIAGQRQLPIDITLSAEEKSLFHTDAQNVRASAEDTQDPAATPAAAEHPPVPTRESTRTGEPAPGSTTTVLSPSGANGAGADRRPPPDLDQLAPASTLGSAPVGDDGRRNGQVYALTGPSAPEVAFSLAGMLSTAATQLQTGGRVLMVDACGTLSAAEKFAGIQLPPTDRLAGLLAESRVPVAAGPSTAGPAGPARSRNGDGPATGEGDINDYLISDGVSGLHILRSPRDSSLSAAQIADAATSDFDCIVVACGTARHGRWERYAKEWVLAASRVAAAAPDAKGLDDTLRSLWAIADFEDQPTCVVTGAPAEAASGRLPEGVSAAEVLVLPRASHLRQCMAQGAFYHVQTAAEPGSADGFAWLAERLGGERA